jgi:hypothetical protein
MTTRPSTEPNDKNTEPPTPETLQSQADRVPSVLHAAVTSSEAKTRPRLHRGAYRPSHKATFIGLSVVVAILAINVGVVMFVMKGQSKSSASVSQGEVTLSPAVLDTLGVSHSPVGSSGTELVVSPNSRFNGTLTVGSDVSIGGQLKLNSKFSASDANLAKLQAGDTQLDKVNINGDATVSNLNLRKDLTVLGLTRLQGPVTLSQLLTVNNNVNITGSLAVGGTLSARSFQASSLVSDTTLTIGGHVITRGSAPSVGPGSALGNNGTISISGNDAAGTVAANIGTGASSGIIAYVTFRQSYSATPHVVVTGVGSGNGSVYVNRSASGFSIGVSNSLSPGGYAFDYIVMQ